MAKTGDLEAQFAGVDLGVVAGDVAGLLQRADAAQAGRRGNAHAAGQFHVGHPAIGLKFGQDAPVDRVQLVSGHVVSLIACLLGAWPAPRNIVSRKGARPYPFRKRSPFPQAFGAFGARGLCLYRAG
jgi:hypothetical protein